MTTSKTKRRGLTPEEDRIRKVVVRWFNASGMTQQAVADRVGLGQTAVSAFLSGRRFGSVDTLKAFCRCFGYQLGDLFTDEPTELPDSNENRLLKTYRTLNPKMQGALVALLDSLQATEGRRAASRSKRRVA